MFLPYNTRSEVTGSSNDVLTAAEYAPAYTYDPIGNRTGNTVDLNGTTAYTANQLNQYTAVGSNSPTYDADGNLTSDGGTWTYIWNNENRLRSATDGTATINFVYDYQGRLVRKTQTTANKQTENRKTDEDLVFVYDGWNRIAKFLQTSNLTLHTSYLWGLDLSGTLQGAGGVGGLLKESEFDSNSQLQTSLFCLYDGNGNVMQKLDDVGNVVMNVSYDPFGNVVSGKLIGEYGFSTKPFVDELDWYYYGFRYYDPVTGRWPSRDPIKEYSFVIDFLEYDGVDLELVFYWFFAPSSAFVQNDSLNNWDLLGLAHPKKKQSTGKFTGKKKEKHQKGGSRPKGGARPGRTKPNFKPRSGAFIPFIFSVMMFNTHQNGAPDIPANCSIINDPGKGCLKKWRCTCPSGWIPSDPREVESVSKPSLNCQDPKTFFNEPKFT